MSDERVILRADLSKIEWSLNQVQSQISHIDQHVDVIDDRLSETSSQVDHIRLQLDGLYHEFHAFLDADKKAKERQFAATEVIRVRQELEQKFGHHDEVRRHITGILQASDVSLVRQETISNVTEELMLAAREYWLAPCLIAVAGWLADDRELAERAVRVGESRDSDKTCLLFALVCRRLGRHSASSAWLGRFFALQDPTQITPETVVMIDAVAGGVFGGDARRRCADTMAGWIEELSGRVGFVEEQREQWRSGLLSRSAASPVAGFTYLPEHSATWPQLQASLRGAALHEQLTTYFQGIFDGPIAPSPSLFAAVDELLDKLVTDYDADELPLRREERRLTLIVEARGDTAEADRKLALEREALAERVSFTQLLTNAAMHPETSHSSRATQRYAVALSKDWICQAHQDLTAQNRASVPVEIQITIGNWSAQSRGGGNEAELQQAMVQDLDRREQTALESVRLTPLDYGAAALGSVFVLFGLITLFSQGAAGVLLVGLGCAGVGWFFYQRSQLEVRRQRVQEEFAELKKRSQAILKACLAEIVDWRQAYAGADAHASRFTEVLDAITPEQHVHTSHDRGRAVLAAATAHGG